MASGIRVCNELCSGFNFGRTSASAGAWINSINGLAQLLNCNLGSRFSAETPADAVAVVAPAPEETKLFKILLPKSAAALSRPVSLV